MAALEIYPAATANLAVIAALIRSAAALPLAFIGALLVCATSYAALRRGLNRPAYRFRDLSPERIVSYRERRRIDPEGGEIPETPEELAASIVERATEMRRVLEEDDSEVRAEMCAIGYRNCVNDMITLTHLVNVQSAESPALRRWRLGRLRKRTVQSLSRVREMLPTEVLKASRQEKQ